MSKEKEKEAFDPRKTLNADKWANMKLHQLYAQELLLQEKIDVSQQLNNIPMEVQLKRGMTLLQTYITELTKDDPDPRITIISR